MDDFVPPGWTDAPTGVNLDFQYEYVTQRKGTTGDWGKYSLPALWGRYSEDGATVEYVYIRTTLEDALAAPTTTTVQDETDDFVPAGYTDMPQGVNDTWPYEWLSERTGISGDWEKFSVPVLQWRVSPGADGVGIEFIYMRTQDEYAPPTPATTTVQDETDDIQPTGWTDAPQGVNKSHGLLNGYRSVPARPVTGGSSLFRYCNGGLGDPGLDGAGIEFVFIRTMTNTAPADITTTTVQDETDDHVPDGRLDG